MYTSFSYFISIQQKFKLESQKRQNVSCHIRLEGPENGAAANIWEIRRLKIARVLFIIQSGSKDQQMKRRLDSEAESGSKDQNQPYAVVFHLISTHIADTCNLSQVNLVSIVWDAQNRSNTNI